MVLPRGDKLFRTPYGVTAFTKREQREITLKVWEEALATSGSRNAATEFPATPTPPEFFLFFLTPPILSSDNSR